MKIFVTGAAGFIGFSLSLELLKKKHIIYAIDNLDNLIGNRWPYKYRKTEKQWFRHKPLKTIDSSRHTISEKNNEVSFVFILLIY